MITDDALREYADQLERAGFVIYESTSRGVSRYFRYSRMVDGKECFGYVQRAYTGSGYEHTMPILPTVHNGSSMWVYGARDELTVETATKVASPRNHNPLVGWQENWENPTFSHLYRRRTEVKP